MSLGALTTQFTPSPSCLASSNIWEIMTSEYSLPVSPYHYYQLFGEPSDRQTGCYPSSWDPTPTAYYSPAICPSGYSVASTSKKTDGSLTETMEVCCPTAMNFTYVSRSSSEFLSTLVCESSYDSRNPRLVTVTSSFLTDEPFTTTTVLSTGAMNAYGIFVKYKSGGLGGSKTEASSGNSNSGGSSSSTDAPTSSNTAVSPDGKGRLSTGASIGIGISIGVVFFALVIGTVFFVLRRRKNAKMLPVSSQHLESSQDGRQNLAGLAGKRHYSNQLDELQPQVK